MKKWLMLAVAFAISACSAAPEATPGVDWVAHRGESADAPENTVAAVQLAWERGVPGVEIDVHLTRDDRLVVLHDFNTSRTTGVSLEVKDSDLADVHGLDAGSWKDARWAGEPLPTLEEVLATIPEDGRLFIEVKVGAEAIPAMVRAIEESGKRSDQLVVISFQADAVAESKRRLPDVPAYYLSSFKQDSVTGTWSPSVEELIATARETGADGLDLSVNGPVDAAFVRQVKDAGMGIYVWTVDDVAVAQRMIDAGVDGITSNRPTALSQEVLNRSAGGATP